MMGTCIVAFVLGLIQVAATYCRPFQNFIHLHLELHLFRS